MDSEILNAAKLVWNYHHMDHHIEPSDLIMVLWSHDLRVADRAIELYQSGYANTVLFSGGLGRLTSDSHEFHGTTEAEKFAQRALDAWVPAHAIIIENRSTNTGENIRFSFDLLRRLDMPVRSIILVQKPYMERRTFATFSKQWPDTTTLFRVTSPQISFEDYPNDDISMERVIDIMVGDLQRIIEYPKLWFQIEQEIDSITMGVYRKLIAAGFTGSLIKNPSM